MIVLAVVAGLVTLWSMVDTVQAARSPRGYDPAIYLRVTILSALVCIALFLASASGDRS